MDGPTAAPGPGPGCDSGWANQLGQGPAGGVFSVRGSSCGPSSRCTPHKPALFQLFPIWGHLALGSTVRALFSWESWPWGTTTPTSPTPAVPRIPRAQGNVRLPAPVGASLPGGIRAPIPARPPLAIPSRCPHAPTTSTCRARPPPRARSARGRREMAVLLFARGWRTRVGRAAARRGRGRCGEGAGSTLAGLPAVTERGAGWGGGPGLRVLPGLPAGAAWWGWG